MHENMARSAAFAVADDPMCFSNPLFFVIYPLAAFDQAREEMWRRNRMRALEGPPGSGKTTVACALVEEATEEGLRVLWTVFTAQLAARMRERLRKGVVVDTCHAALGLDDSIAECCLCLSPYDLVIVDEFSRLQGKHLEHLEQLRNAVERFPAVGLLGDPHQLPGFGPERVWRARAWRLAVHVANLHELFRCVGPEFRRVLRTSKPTATRRHGPVAILDILRGRKAWKGSQPTVSDMRRLLENHPNTTFMAITRRGAARLNELAILALFHKKKAVAVLNGDIESNPLNYGQMKGPRSCKALQVPCHKGMKIFLTRNLDKDRDFVNGMGAAIEKYDAQAQALVCITTTGHRLPLRPWSDPTFHQAYFPFRPGRASTVLKLAGAELPHVVIWLDAKHVPGAAYTGMSRVARSQDLLFGDRPQSFKATRQRAPPLKAKH